MIIIAGGVAGLLGLEAGAGAKPKNKPTPATPAPSGPCSKPDADGDSHAKIDCGGDDCDDADAAVYPGAAEICDAAARDEDCNPKTYGVRDADGDGYGDARCCNGTRCGLDCDDARTNVNPRAPEVCNGRDDNCDGGVDDGLKLTVWRDEDKDLYGDPNTSAQVCPHEVTSGWVTNDYDCNDQSTRINPRTGKCVP